MIFKNKMMKFCRNTPIAIVVLILFFNVGLSSKANAQGIEFMYDLDQAIAKAQQENKLVFVDFYTSWCGPCKVLDKTVFPVEKVGEFFNANFVSCKIQCDDGGIGVELGKKYDVIAYPTLMFLDGEGEMVHVQAGASSADALIEIGKTALNPELNLKSMMTKWDSGNRDEDFVNQYFKSLKKFYRYEKASSDFLEYFNELDPSAKTSKHIFELFELVGIASLSSTFDYLENNYNTFVKNIGKDEVDNFIADSYLWHFKNMSQNAPKDEYKDAMKKFKAKKHPFYDEYELFYQVFEATDDVEEYQKRGTEFLAKYGTNRDAYTLNLTSLLGNLTGRPEQGAAGVQWMEDLLERNDNPQYLQVYVYILWRNFRYDKALEVVKKMRANAVEDGKPTEQIDKQIEEIVGMKERYELKTKS